MLYPDQPEKQASPSTVYTCLYRETAKDPALKENFLSLFFENVPDTYIELHITLLINDRVLLKINKYSNSQLFYMNLWKMGNHYNIVNETSLNDAFIDLKNKIGEYLIPYIKKLEGGNV
jgi:hypothetical protein